MRLSHIAASPPNPCHFTVLVRSIPKSTEESLSESVKSFFSNYHASTYLSHQMIYRTGKVQKIMVCMFPSQIFIYFSSLGKYLMLFVNGFLLSTEKCREYVQKVCAN